MRPNLEAILCMELKYKKTKNGNDYAVVLLECSECKEEIERNPYYKAVNPEILCISCSRKKKSILNVIEGDSKICTGCNKDLPLNKFGNSGGYRNGNKMCNRCYALKKYGISGQDYENMLEEQGGVCAICGNPETDLRNGEVCSLAVDHYHETGEVRGLLCRSCNTAIGLLKDDVEILNKAIDYLNRNTNEQQI